MRLTFIGSGNMAEAIIKGCYKIFDIEVVARDEARLTYLQKNYGVDIVKFDKDFSIDGKNIVLCVKPYALEDVSQKLFGCANSLISVLAGTTIDSLKNFIKSDNYVRIMPNLAAKYQKSMTTLCGDQNFKKEALLLCKSFGKVLWLDSEKELDIATALAGSGPAFLSIIAESLSDGAVKEGLKRDDANILVRGLFEGFSALIEDNHPAILKDEVTSPGGTTAAGLFALEKAGVRSAFIEAISQAYFKAKNS